MGGAPRTTASFYSAKLCIIIHFLLSNILKVIFRNPDSTVQCLQFSLRQSSLDSPIFDTLQISEVRHIATVSLSVLLQLYNQIFNIFRHPRIFRSWITCAEIGKAFFFSELLPHILQQLTFPEFHFETEAKVDFPSACI